MSRFQREGKKHGIERLPVSHLGQHGFIIDEDETGGRFGTHIEALFQRGDRRLGKVRLGRKGCRDRLDGCARAYHHAVGRKVREHARGLGWLERDDHVGGALRNERGDYFLPGIAHPNMRHHATATLRHADRLGSTNLPSFCLGRLRENFRGKDRSLPANAGQKHVTHGTPPSPPRFPAARSP